MLDHEDLKWIATTSTELNTMLQQIARYADLARQHKGEYNYIEMLGERVELAATMLTDEGYRVILARDGFEALKIYQQIGKQIALVILDFFLPVMDGDAVFDELRTINPEVAVVLSSGFAEQSKLGVMLAQGLKGFIPKPYTAEKLLEQVRSTIDAARLSGS